MSLASCMKHCNLSLGEEVEYEVYANRMEEEDNLVRRGSLSGRGGGGDR